MVEVGRDEAVLHAQVLPAVGHGGRGGHGGEDFIVGEAGAEAFHHGVGKGNQTGVPHHAVRLIAHQVPDREVALLLVNMVHGGHDVVHLFGMDERHQRHGGPVGVPEGEGGIVLEIALAHQVVASAVLAVHVIVPAGGHHRMVEGGVEDRALIGIVGFDFHLAQFLVPGGAGGSLDGLEVPAGEFGGHVGLGAFH